MLLAKLISIGSRIKYYFSKWPIRFWRVISFPGVSRFRVSYLHLWICEWILLILDLLGLPEILEILHEFVNWKLRNLIESELDLGKRYFGDSIALKRIRINPSDYLISKKLNIAFVSFYTIHYFETISDATFVHELIHIWQFEKIGSPYIVRSLWAKLQPEGYDYGGVHSLLRDKAQNKQLLDYNYEQMGDIVRDAYLYDQGNERIPDDLNPFPYFLEQIKNRRN